MLWLLGCAEPPPAAIPSPCDVVTAAGGVEPLPFALAAVAEGRSTGDEGAYVLADQGVRCALEHDPASVPARRLQAHVRVQQHRFAEAAALAEPLARETGDWATWIVVGDALIEQGQVDGAAMAYQEAADHRPGLVVYDRISHLRWFEGDIEGAREAATWAVESGSPADPEPYAWALSWLGWLKVLNREAAPELDTAVQIVPGYAPALLNRGRARLHEDGPAYDPGAGTQDLLGLSRSAEARRALGAPLLRAADPRGWADWLAPTEPAAALAALDEELKARRDPVTRGARAWGMFHVARSASAPTAEAEAEARALLATGHPEPRLLHHAAVILRDRATAERALWMGAGLTRAERDELRALIAE